MGTYIFRLRYFIARGCFCCSEPAGSAVSARSDQKRIGGDVPTDGKPLPRGRTDQSAVRHSSRGRGQDLGAGRERYCRSESHT